MAIPLCVPVGPSHDLAFAFSWRRRVDNQLVSLRPRAHPTSQPWRPVTHPALQALSFDPETDSDEPRGTRIINTHPSHTLLTHGLHTCNKPLVPSRIHFFLVQHQTRHCSPSSASRNQHRTHPARLAADVTPCHTGILHTAVSSPLLSALIATGTRLTPSQNRLPKASGELLHLRRVAMVTVATTRDHRPHIRHTPLKATPHIHPTASPHLIRATARRLLDHHHLSSTAHRHRLHPAAHTPTTTNSLRQGHRLASTEPRPNMGHPRRPVSPRRLPPATAHRRASSGTQGRPPTR